MNLGRWLLVVALSLSPSPALASNSYVKSYLLSQHKLSLITMCKGPAIAIVCIILQIIVFVFVVIATPIDALREKGKPALLPAAGINARLCYSLWGPKKCGAHKIQKAFGYAYFYPDGKGFPDKSILHIMQAAQAFTIISIFFSLVTLILSILLVCKCVLGFIPGIFAILNIICLVIVIGTVLGAFDKKFVLAATGTTHKIKTFFRLYAAVVLIIIAFVLQIVYTILVFCA